MNQNLNLESFVERLYEEKKFPADLEKEVADQIKTDLLNQLEDRINAVIISNLSTEKLEEFNTLLDADTADEQMQEFFLSAIPDLSQLIAAELLVFKQSYLA